jgi:Transposase DDE domain
MQLGMYVRSIHRKNKDGSSVEYVQLAHNAWNPEKGFAQAEVIYSFGRKDQLDIEAIKRLVNSLCRFLDPEDALTLQAKTGEHEPLPFVRSRPAGGAYLLKALWDRLHIGACLKAALKDREFTAPVEQALFAMVANRALSPSSKLAIEQWTAEEVFLGGDESPLQVQHFYRAMDFLLEHAESLQKEVFWSTASLLNLTVDLIFFDTTNTYFEIEEPGPSELKAYGKSKEKRDDLPLVTVGLAVTREGIPVRCWVLPGNQHDSQSVAQVQQDLNHWKLGRVVWVMDRGMTSDENRRILQKAGGQYILGEKLRGTHMSEMALRQPGRFKVIADNLHAKQVYVGEGTGRRRYVIASNPQQAEADRITREQNLDRLRCELEVINTKKRKKPHCRLLLHPSRGRYVKELKSGKLKIDLAKVKQEEALDGKYLLSTSDESLAVEDIALGYKQLLEVERAFRTLKNSLSLRPIYHSKDDRIRSHVLICWLALLLVRLAEVETDMSWAVIRRIMQRLHLGEFLNEKNRVLRHTALSSEQANILKRLKITPPKPFVKLETTP